MVSVDVVTREAGVAEISGILGIPGSPSSHNKGDKRGFKGDVWNVTTWKLESGLEGGRPLREHVDQLLPRVLPAITRERATLPNDCRVWLSIGAIFHTATCGISLSADHLKLLSDTGIGLEVTAYPGA